MLRALRRDVLLGGVKVREEEIDLAAVHAELVSLEQKRKAALDKHNAFLKELGLPMLP